MNRPATAGAITGLIILLLVSATTAATKKQTAEAIQVCLHCHDYGEDAPVHQVLLGSHGIEGEGEDMATRRGCMECHGDSKAHIETPRRQSPDTSFGPHWGSGAGAQDQRCLACHEEDVAGNWRHALHMFNNLTCVTCHDIHAAEDRVLFAPQQAEVCTTCHKAQKSGIHDLGQDISEDPPCSLCHNPHDHESATTRMRENQSQGCVYCHDQQQMDGLAAINNKAGNYHRVMADPAHSCIDCHEGIAHAPEGSALPIHPSPARGRSVTLFYPGGIDHQWLLQEHPGSQPLRQGTHCQRCHRGDEAEMGASLAAGITPSSREIGIAFALQGDDLHIELSWEGPASDRHVALMWGDGQFSTFRQGGCFAACHTREDGPKIWSGKYLHNDKQAPPSPEGTMGSAVAAGERAELWRIPLGSEAASTALIAESANPRTANQLVVGKQHDNGRWTVSLRLELERAADGIHFSREGRYTFGIALHGAANSGREHWTSLPMSLSFGGIDTDFTAQ